MANIILIGPICAGKSTVAELLSQKTGMPRCSLDDIRYKYYEELNYDHNHALELQEKYGFWEKYKYWKPFEAHLVVRVLEEYTDHIIDFGAGHSVYEEEALFQKVDRALHNEPFVFLLIPSRNREESAQILCERSELDFNRHFVEHYSNEKLAKHIIYTKNHTPEETMREIMSYTLRRN